MCFFHCPSTLSDNFMKLKAFHNGDCIYWISKAFRFTVFPITMKEHSKAANSSECSWRVESKALSDNVTEPDWGSFPIINHLTVKRTCDGQIFLMMEAVDFTATKLKFVKEIIRSSFRKIEAFKERKLQTNFKKRVDTNFSFWTYKCRTWKAKRKPKFWKRTNFQALPTCQEQDFRADEHFIHSVSLKGCSSDIDSYYASWTFCFRPSEFSRRLSSWLRTWSFVKICSTSKKLKFNWKEMF